MRGTRVRIDDSVRGHRRWGRAPRARERWARRLAGPLLAGALVPAPAIGQTKAFSNTVKF